MRKKLKESWPFSDKRGMNQTSVLISVFRRMPRGIRPSWIECADDHDTAVAIRRRKRGIAAWMITASMGICGLAWAEAPAIPRTLPSTARPWLNESTLLGRAGPEITSKLTLVFAGLAEFPSDDNIERLFGAIWNIRCEGSDPLAAEQRLIEARWRSKAQDHGVNFDAGLRIDPNTGNPDSGGHNAYAGLSWDYYRDGLWSNRLQAESLRLEGELRAARLAQTESRRHLDCRHTRFIAAFNGLKLKVLADREAYLRQLHGLYRQAYFQGLINLDEVILIERDLERTRHLVAGFRSYNARLEELGDKPIELLGEPPLLDVQIEALLAAVKDDPSYQKIAGLERGIVDNNYDPRHDRRLRFYVHPRLKWDDSFNTGADLVAGITFSMPLTEDKREMRDIDRSVSALRQDEARQHLSNEILRLYYEYKYRLDDAIKLHYQRNLVLERLRRDFAGMEIASVTPGGGSLPRVLQGMRDLVDTQFEILDVKQNLYLRLLQILSNSNQGYRRAFLVPVEESVMHLRGRLGSRALYIWSQGFNEFDNALLVHVLKTKAIKTVVVSAGQKTDLAKLRRFMELARAADIRVELMVSDNTWVSSGKTAKVDTAVARLFTLGAHLHLDVEPHTLKDFKENRGAYLGRLAKLLQSIGGMKRPGQSVSISLPTLLTQAEVDAIAAHADQIYAMAYGTGDPDALLRRLEPFRNVPRDRLVVALRPADFAGELALEDFIGAVMRRSDVKRFAFHDLTQFQSMIEQSQ